MLLAALIILILIIIKYFFLHFMQFFIVKIFAYGLLWDNVIVTFLIIKQKRTNRPTSETSQVTYVTMIPRGNERGGECHQ